MIESSAQHSPPPQRAIYAALVVSSLLIAAKLYGWMVTGSLSIFSSLVDSFIDLLTSSLNLFAIHYAQKPADDDHRFGHTSIEDIVGLLQAAFIAGSAFFIIVEALGRTISPQIIEQPLFGSGIMIASLLLTSLLVSYQHYILRKTNNIVVSADALHYVSDLLMNLAIIASLIAIYYFEVFWLDVVLASLIALYMIHGAWCIGIRAFNNLMDKELDEDNKEIIRNIISSYDQVSSYHALKTRISGSKIFVQVHIELDGNMSLKAAHDVTDAIEKQIESTLENAEVIIHQDPIGAPLDDV